MMQAVGKQFKTVNEVANVYEPTERRFPSSSLWTSIVNVTHVFQCFNVVMFNISFVFEIFASHPQPPNEGLGVPCPKQGTTTWIANPTWSKKCMQIYLPVRVVIQRLKTQQTRVQDWQISLGYLRSRFAVISPLKYARFCVAIATSSFTRNPIMEVVERSASCGGCDYDAIAAQYDSLHKDPESLQEDQAIAGFSREFLGRFGRCGHRNKK